MGAGTAAKHVPRLIFIALSLSILFSACISSGFYFLRDSIALAFTDDTDVVRVFDENILGKSRGKRVQQVHPLSSHELMDAIASPPS